MCKLFYKLFDFIFGPSITKLLEMDDEIIVEAVIIYEI